MKYHIEKTPCRKRSLFRSTGGKCARNYIRISTVTRRALRLINQIDYDFSLLSKKSKSLMQQFGFLEAAMRQNDLAWEVRDYRAGIRTQRLSTSAADWTIRAAAAITERVKSTI